MRLDLLIRAWVVTHRAGALDPLMLAITLIGRGGLVWLASGVALATMRRLSFRALMTLAAAILMATLAADHVLKPLINRTRPFATAPAVAVIGDTPDGSSFPSGHAANAFAGATVLSEFFPALRLAWWVLAVAIAYSRVYLGVHYPLDVLGGAMLGIMSALAALKLSAAVRSRWT